RPPPVAVVPKPPPPDAAPAGPPAARTVDVVDHDFGLDVADPYRWMETGGDELTAWLRAQGEHTEQLLAALPERDRLRVRVRELGLAVTAVFDVQIGGDRLFHYVVPAGAQLAQLAVRDGGGKVRVLVDPARFGAHAALHAYAPSPDGSRVAYVVSSGGAE